MRGAKMILQHGRRRTEPCGGGPQTRDLSHIVLVLAERRRRGATCLHGPTEPTSALDEKPPGTRCDLQKRPPKASPSRSRIPKRRQKRFSDRSRMRERCPKASRRSSSFLPARPNPFRRRSRMRERCQKRLGERSRTPPRRRERSCRRFCMLKPPPKRLLRHSKTSPACRKRFDSRFDTPETPAQRSRPSRPASAARGGRGRQPSGTWGSSDRPTAGDGRAGAFPRRGGAGAGCRRRCRRTRDRRRPWTAPRPRRAP